MQKMQYRRSRQDWNKLPKEQAVFALYTNSDLSTKTQICILITSSVSAVVLAAILREKSTYSIAFSSKGLSFKLEASDSSGGDHHKMAQSEVDVSK